jgi:Family of unknown function (DUF5923)
MSNSEFRILVSDLTTLSRQVFKDTALSLSGVAENVGQQLAVEPQASGEAAQDLIQLSESKPVNNGASSSDSLQENITVRNDPSTDDASLQKGSNVASNGEVNLGKTVTEVTDLVLVGSTKVVDDTKNSVVDKFSARDNKQVLLNRLKQTVLSLGQRPDYDTAVETLATIVKRFILTYSRVLEEATAIADTDIKENDEADEAVKRAWSFATSFGDAKEWSRLKDTFEAVIQHKERDPEFEDLATSTVDSLEKLLTDPNFGESIDEKFTDLRKKSRKVELESDLRGDVDLFLDQLQRTIKSVLNDQDVANVIDRASRILDIVSPDGAYVSHDLVRDGINIFTPALIAAIQTVPIPRLEVSTPTIDILLENLFLTPGHTVNNSSFLPYHLKITAFNALDVHKHRVSSEVSSRVSTSFTISLSGFSLRAEDVGYVIRTHYPLIPFSSSGLASIALDERGTDVEITLDVERNSLEDILKLRAVKVNVHKLSYKLTNSPFSLFAWILKPFLQPILRKVMQKQIAQGIAAGIHALNREFLFARERVRVAEVSQPGSVWALLKALKARWTPEQDPDMDVRVGLDAPADKSSAFRGVYAPGSLAGIWWKEERRREEREVTDWNRGWRNSVFDVGA